MRIRTQEHSCRSSLSATSNLLHQRVEARLAAQVVKQSICLDNKKVVGRTFFAGMLQLLDRTVFVT